MCRRTRRSVAQHAGVVWMATILILAPSVGVAGDSEEREEPSSSTSTAAEDASRGRRVAFEGIDGYVVRPKGWVDAETGKGALATFRAASDKSAQIEVRVSTSIPEKKSESFFNSFHSKLKRAGFSEVGEPKPKTYGDKPGEETEYEGSASAGKFRLIVWTFHRDKNAWLFAAFLPADRRDLHYDAFEDLVRSLTVDGGD